LFATGLQAQEYVPGELIVKLKPSGFKGSTKAFSSVADRMGMKLKGSWRSLDMHAYKVGANEDMEAFAKKVAEDPSVEFAEPNYILNKQNVNTLSNISSLSEMNEKFASTFSQTSANIEVEQAWTSMSSSPNGAVVAVIDTGLDMDHDSFIKLCAIWTNEAELNGSPGVDDDRNGYVDDVHGWNFVANSSNPDDDDGHGTHVSGIVLGTSMDILNLPSSPSEECKGEYQSKVKIMPLKFLDGNGSGSTTDAIAAIYYAVNNGAKVLNNSWGGGAYSRALHEAVIYSYNRKTIFVAASGNSGMDNDMTPMFPANYDVPNVVSVAATSSSDYKASFSNFGESSVHLGSPGVAIYSAVPGGYYGTMSGTSMAAPFVAGVAALISREQPSMLGYQIKDIINRTGNGKSTLSGYTITGKRLNVSNAVNNSKTASIWTEQPEYNLSMSLYDRELASALASGGAGCGLVQSVMKNGGKGPGPGSGGGSGLSRLMLLFALMAPVLLWSALRRKSDDYGRAHKRFKVDSKVKLQVGGREIEGNMGSISMGGAGINVDQMLEHGSVVTLKIQGPDGGELEVDGQIVWTDGGQAHGIQFESMADRVKRSIEKWTDVLAGSTSS
jgi:hypothetical protein